MVMKESDKDGSNDSDVNTGAPYIQREKYKIRITYETHGDEKQRR